jgi:hypothetical protein
MTITTESPLSALQDGRERGTLVIRAEDLAIHKELVRALKAKLTPREHWSHMRQLYGSSDNHSGANSGANSGPNSGYAYGRQHSGSHDTNASSFGFSGST